QWQSDPSKTPCPACQTLMMQGTLGTINLRQCGKCFGIWLDTVSFQQICRDSEHQAATLGVASPEVPQNKPLEPVRYRRCPQCRQLMNRVNFAQHSGVVVDVCRDHGTWFDMNELQQIVLFIRSGGLDAARARDLAELKEEQRRLQLARIDAGRDPELPASRQLGMLSMIAGASRGLLDQLLKR
ncbi:MAG TPA: zf-TFIIB domain-containing protein, partial [Candidatus Nitrosotalea sp.]|nr:zf-TFIIB domain-containing protein [Candidatus Nitrosotalea sp.]